MRRGQEGVPQESKRFALIPHEVDSEVQAVGSTCWPGRRPRGQSRACKVTNARDPAGNGRNRQRPDSSKQRYR